MGGWQKKEDAHVEDDGIEKKEDSKKDDDIEKDEGR